MSPIGDKLKDKTNGYTEVNYGDNDDFKEGSEYMICEYRGNNPTGEPFKATLTKKDDSGNYTFLTDGKEITVTAQTHVIFKNNQIRKSMFSSMFGGKKSRKSKKSMKSRKSKKSRK